MKLAEAIGVIAKAIETEAKSYLVDKVDEFLQAHTAPANETEAAELLKATTELLDGEGGYMTDKPETAGGENG